MKIVIIFDLSICLFSFFAKKKQQKFTKLIVKQKKKKKNYFEILKIKDFFSKCTH